jgi:hypothetical protein
MSKCNKAKKGQVGETISWLIATLVIIGVLLLFIWISVMMSKVKVIAVGDLRTDSGKESVILTMKTSLANQLNNENKEVIDNILKEDAA